jgi:hypothetical protein
MRDEIHSWELGSESNYSEHGLEIHFITVIRL